MLSRSSPIVLLLRLLWGVIPLAAAATIVIGLALPEMKQPLIFTGMAVGVGWLAAHFLASRSRCRGCKRWFAGDAVGRLPVSGTTDLPIMGTFKTRPQWEVTYRCRFCGFISFEKE